MSDYNQGINPVFFLLNIKWVEWLL